MRPLDLRDQLRRAPFQPLRLFLSDGSHYDIPHPEAAMVSRTMVVIGLRGQRGDLPERLAHCDPLHVTRIEPIDTDSAPSS